MLLVEEIDLNNPFTMSDLLTESAWDNCYTLYKRGYYDTVVDILESSSEMTRTQLNDFFRFDVIEIFPEVFNDENEESDEEE